MFHLIPKSYAATRSGRLAFVCGGQREIGPHFRGRLSKCRRPRTATRT